MVRPPALPLCLLLADVVGWGYVGRPASAQEDGASRAGGLGEVAGAAAGALADAALGAAAVQVDPFRSGNPILVAEGAAPIRQVSLTAPTYNTGLQKLSAAANYGVFFNDDPKRLPLSRDNLFYYQYPPNLYKRFYMPYTISDVYNGLTFGSRFDGACGAFNEGNFAEDILDREYTTQAALFLWFVQLSCNGAYAAMTVVAKTLCAVAYLSQQGYCVQ